MPRGNAREKRGSILNIKEYNSGGIAKRGTYVLRAMWEVMSRTRRNRHTRPLDIDGWGFSGDPTEHSIRVVSLGRYNQSLLGKQLVKTQKKAMKWHQPCEILARFMFKFRWPKAKAVTNFGQYQNCLSIKFQLAHNKPKAKPGQVSW